MNKYNLKKILSLEMISNEVLIQVEKKSAADTMGSIAAFMQIVSLAGGVYEIVNSTLRIA